MDIQEAAAALDGNQYGSEGSAELFASLKESGLVAVFGQSDDIMALRGAANDELYDDTAYFTPDGLLHNECEDDRCPHFEKLKRRASPVTAIWDDGSGYSWRYRTDIPHATFVIKEDEDLYCEGIVFALKDAIKRAA
jgi:hypothetical protein